MKLISIELENIRSYEQGALIFPEGSILLSGNVGSGKSTVLLAAEFALFGIRRGELSGGALLRRGKKSGHVRLTISLDNKEITVERKLRRTTSSVGQVSGSITIDGVETSYTPKELKAKILTLLGYPLDLLDKQKSLLYRYTVYTPQEQLKNIMWTTAEDRLNTLRKVFGVDRYKIIQENLGQFLTQLRAKKRLLAGIHRDLDEKLIAEKSLDEQLAEAKRQETKWKKRETEIKSDLEKWKDEKRAIDENVRLYNEYDKKLYIESGNEKTARDQLEKKEEEKISFRESIDRIDKLESPTDLSEEEIEKSIGDLDKKVKKCLTESRGVNKTIDENLDKIDSTAKIIEGQKERVTQIRTLLQGLTKSKRELKEARSMCPICGKELDEVHRKKKMVEYTEQMDTLKQENIKLKEDLKALAAEETKIRKKVKDGVDAIVKSCEKEKEKMELLKEELREYTSDIGMREDYVKYIEGAEEDAKTLLKSIEKIEGVIREVKEKLEELGDVEERRREIEEKLEEIRISLEPITKGLGSAKEAKKQLVDRIKELDIEIKEKKGARDFEDRLTSFEGWLRDHLINLAGTIEKHFMVELKRKFDPLFRDWFNMLIDDEDMDARIDDEFTPVVEKEGYEAEYETLSGGESASVALAYRLALNKVVSTMIEEIKTKDIIILDEPTDGFSNAQMDKIRDVVNELGVGQTIIVSHEPKIESYVDNIVRIRKEEGLSQFHN
ncbi:MAG: AAA family ATPase [Candidatus Thorarchaeota archaeon]